MFLNLELLIYLFIELKQLNKLLSWQNPSSTPDNVYNIDMELSTHTLD